MIRFFFALAGSKIGVASLVTGLKNWLISQEWINRMNWFFVCRCKFRKSWSYFADFWLGMVRNGHGYLVHETQKLACVPYFSLFVKEHCVSWLFLTKYFERKLNLHLFFLPTVSRTFILSWIPRAARLLKTSCFEKVTMCNRDNARDIAACPDISSTNRSEPTNQAQIKIKSTYCNSLNSCKL